MKQFADAVRISERQTGALDDAILNPAHSAMTVGRPIPLDRLAASIIRSCLAFSAVSLIAETDRTPFKVGGSRQARESRRDLPAAQI
jgi:hypothetical protein